MRITLHPAFILHVRPMNETSSLLDVFTQAHGRITLVARAARSRFRGILRPFTPLLISWSGKTELMSLSAAESAGLPCMLSGIGLLSGIYINEILVRLLPRFDPLPELFDLYRLLMPNLQQPQILARTLRLFEKALLAELGYGLSLDREVTGTKITPEHSYQFIVGQGFAKYEQNRSQQPAQIFQGSSLLAFHHETLEQTIDLRAAKQLTRLALTGLLGDKPLKSRELLR